APSSDRPRRLARDGERVARARELRRGAMATTEIDRRELEQRGIDVIRGLAMDAVQKANSGHPGTPMALAPLAHVLFTRIMKYDASDPAWPDRDRFVLSN